MIKKMPDGIMDGFSVFDIDSGQNGRSPNSRPNTHITIMIDHLRKIEAILSNLVGEHTQFLTDRQMDR